MDKSINEHLTMDEMMSFLCAQKLDNAFFIQATRINSHIFKCEKCRKKYEVLMAFSEALEKAANYVPEEKLLKLKIADKLFEFENKLNPGEVVLSECVSRLEGLADSLKLKLDEFGELLCERLTYGSAFRHPAYAASLKSNSLSGDCSSTEEIMTMVVDDEGSSISVGLDHSISFALHKSECGPGRIAVLLPVSPEMEPAFALCTDDELGEEGLVKFVFEDVPEGDYTLSFL